MIELSILLETYEKDSGSVNIQDEMSQEIISFTADKKIV